MKKYYLKANPKILDKYGYTKEIDDTEYYEKCIYYNSYTDEADYSYIQIDVKTRLIVNNNSYYNENYDIDFNDIKDLLLAGLVEERNE